MTEVALRGSDNTFTLKVQPELIGEVKHRWLDIGDCLEGEFVAGQLVGIVVPTLCSLFDEETGRYLVEYFDAGEGFDDLFGPFKYGDDTFHSLEALLHHLLLQQTAPTNKKEPHRNE